jgi:hypothetical protein
VVTAIITWRLSWIAFPVWYITLVTFRTKRSRHARLNVLVLCTRSEVRFRFAGPRRDIAFERLVTAESSEQTWWVGLLSTKSELRFRFAGPSWDIAFERLVSTKSSEQAWWVGLLCPKGDYWLWSAGPSWDITFKRLILAEGSEQAGIISDFITST